MARESTLSAPPASFFLVPLEHLEPETVLGFDLYLHRGTAEPLLYRSRALAFTRDVQERLLQNGVQELLVPAEQADDYHSYRRLHAPPPPPPRPAPGRTVEGSLTQVLADTRVPVRSRASALLGVSRTVVEEALSDLGRPGLAERVTRVAQETARFLSREPQAFAALVSLLETDLDVYNHSVRTSLYATELARAAGMRDEGALTAIGRAAMVHDVGRGPVALELLHRAVGRDEEEWTDVRGHVERGLALLRESGFADTVSLEVCAHHHERCDGSGYPGGLRREQIPPAARVVAIADIFDALTSSGRRHMALTGYQALWRLAHGRPGAFDPDLLAVFVRRLVEPTGPPRR